MNTAEEEDILILEQKLKEICSECKKLEDGVNKLKTQAEKCVEELNTLRSSTVRKLKLYDCSEKLDLIYGILIKLNYELELSDVDILHEAVVPSISHISVETSTNSLKYLSGDNPWNFWLQQNSSDIKITYKLLIEKFENGLLKSCLRLPAIGESVCYAVRRRMFRGIVTQHLENERLKVIDVDTSCIKVLPLSEFYQVDADVCELPAQAIKCCVSEDIHNCFMWSSDLGTMFTDVLRNGNLHVKICKQLSGFPPQFVVEIRVINDEEEGHVDVKEWICERVLPELKEVYVEGVQTLCDFLSSKALDPYFQDQSSALVVRPDDILQDKNMFPGDVKSTEDPVETSQMLHTYSSSETVNIGDTTTKPQSEPLSTNVSPKKIKSPSVADMLERSVATGVHREAYRLAIIADDEDNLTAGICATNYKIDEESEDEKYPNETSKKVEDEQSENEEYRKETSKQVEDEQSDDDDSQKGPLKKGDEQSENKVYRMETSKNLEDEQSENKVYTKEISVNVNESLNCSRDEINKFKTDYPNNCNGIEISNRDAQSVNKDSNEQDTFFANTNHNTYCPLDKVINNVDLKLAEKLASDELALFNQKLTAVMPTFDSQDVLNHEASPTSLARNNENMTDATEPCDNSDDIESRSEKFQSEDSDKLVLGNSLKELSALIDVSSKPTEKITSKTDNSSSDKDGTSVNKFEKESSVSSNSESSKSNETYYSELSEENDSLNGGSKLKNVQTSNKSDFCSEDEVQKSTAMNPFADSSLFRSNNKAPHFNKTYPPKKQPPVNITPHVNSTPFYNYTQVQPPITFRQTPHHFQFQPPPCQPYNQPIIHSNPPPGMVWAFQPNPTEYHQYYHQQQPPQWANVNHFQGHNFQYSAPTTERHQPSHIQWSNGENKPKISNSPQHKSETSESKVSLSEIVAAETSEAVDGIVEDLVLQPDCSASNSLSSLDAVVENYKVKLKHPCTLLKPNEHMSVMMAHIESPGEFYAHVVTENNLHIDNLRDDMFKHYNKTELVVNQSWEDAKNKYGTYCACKWPQDDNWYRVEVIDWNFEGNVLVFFVDYGNRDEVPLSNIQPLAKKFTHLAMMAQPCHLANVFPVDSDYNIWSDDAVSFFKSMVTDREDYKAVVEPSKSHQSSNSLAIKLILSEHENEIVTMNDLLVNEGYAKPKRKISQHSANTSVGDSDRGDNSFAKTPSMDSENTELETFNPLEEDFTNSANCYNMDHESVEVAVTGYKGKGDSNICRFFAQKGKCWKKICRKEHVYKSDRTVAKPFCGLILPDVGETVLLKITHIQSVTQFYGQLQQHINSVDDEEEETLGTLSEYLNRRKNILEMKPLPEPPKAGDLVLAKSSDEFWFRARVLTRPDIDSEVEVMFLDYGTEEFVHVRDLRQIEQRYLHLPFQAVECTLANVCATSNERKTKIGFEIMTKGFTGITLFAKIHSTEDHSAHDMTTSVLSPVTQFDPALCRLEVFLKDNDDTDVGEFLVSKGFCNRIEPSKNLKTPIVPG